jgi:hypothetical protein
MFLALLKLALWKRDQRARELSFLLCHGGRA